MIYTTRHRSRKPRKDSRTLPVKGKNEDEGKYYRCWNCGFICNVDRDELGGSASKDGISYARFSRDYGTGENGEVIASLRSGHVCPKIDADDDAVTVREYWNPDVNSGCPMCGCLNYKGDY